MEDVLRPSERLIWKESCQIILIVIMGGRKLTDVVASQHNTTPASVRQPVHPHSECCAWAALPPVSHPESLAAPGDTGSVSHRFCDTAVRVRTTTIRDRQYQTCTEYSNTDTLAAQPWYNTPLPPIQSYWEDLYWLWWPVGDSFVQPYKQEFCSLDSCLFLVLIS